MTSHPVTTTATTTRWRTLTRRVLAGALALAGVALPAVRAYVFGDPLTFASGKLLLDFNARVRIEDRDNTFDFNSAANAVTDDTLVLTRFRAGAKWTFTPKFVAYVQLQDTREFDSKRLNVPYVNAAEGDDVADLRQAYFDIGDPRDDFVTVRLGRQMLSYADERLIGGFEWNNFARTFDAAKAVFNFADVKTTVDAFASRVVTIRGRNYGDTTDHFTLNSSDSHDLFAGLYAQNSGFIKNQKTDVYLLYRDKDRNYPAYRPNTLTSGATGVLPYDIPEKIWTLGVRAQSISSAPLKGFDYIVEAAYQWGESRPGLTPAVQDVPNWFDHEAYAIHAELGYTIEKSKLMPRFAVEFNQASGDKNPSDTKNESFLNLFHTNHKFYGYMDVMAWKNMCNVALTIRAKPFAYLDSSLKKSILRLDYHWFELQTTQDLWYRANAITAVATPAAAIRAGLPDDVGQEFDATWTWSPSPPYEILLGWSYFSTGGYLPAARAVGGVPGRGDNAKFGYAQLVVKF